jgi:hypothetical protein
MAFTLGRRLTGAGHPATSGTAALAGVELAFLCLGSIREQKGCSSRQGRTR